jgi:hypothetical protein
MYKGANATEKRQGNKSFLSPSQAAAPLRNGYDNREVAASSARGVESQIQKEQNERFIGGAYKITPYVLCTMRAEYKSRKVRLRLQ